MIPPQGIRTSAFMPLGYALLLTLPPRTYMGKGGGSTPPDFVRTRSRNRGGLRTGGGAGQEGRGEGREGEFVGGKEEKNDQISSERVTFLQKFSSAVPIGSLSGPPNPPKIENLEKNSTKI